jgi:hypothetical protein
MRHLKFSYILSGPDQDRVMALLRAPGVAPAPFEDNILCGEGEGKRPRRPIFRGLSLKCEIPALV